MKERACAYTHVFARQEAASQRRVCDDSDAELTRCLEETDLLVLDVEREGRVLDLDGRNGVHRVCTPQALRRAFGKTDVLHFPGSRRHKR